jgi:uncharacterized protein (DUF488 family)
VLYTVGHSTRSLQQFFDLLTPHGITALVDVRRYPGSRRYPHFGKDALAASLVAIAVLYRHDPDLGGRREPRADSGNMAWRNAQFRGYADYMQSPEFAAALARLIELGAERPTAIMCAEAVPWSCHRQLIADALVARGIAVRHIMGEGRSEPHALTLHARVGPEGRVTYPAS